MNYAEMLTKYKQQKLETTMKIDGQDAHHLPKEGKEIEWLLFNILETLQAINGHLARIAALQPKLG